MLAGYSVLSTCGQGAASTIYKVREDRSGEVFALKQLRKDRDPDGRFCRQMEAEFLIGRQISHPNVRHVYEFRKVRRRLKVVEWYLRMEFLEGRTLEQAKITSRTELCEIGASVATGLQALHDAGYIHADIKPNNIMLCGSKGVKIFDLGQSCVAATVKKRIQGTPDFIAPEQVLKMPLDARTDIFNFGATLYWCLTGKPFPTRLQSGAGRSSLNVAASQVESPQEIDPTVSTVLSTLVMDCCRNNPANRPGSMQEVIQRLQAARDISERKRRRKSRSSE